MTGDVCWRLLIDPLYQVATNPSNSNLLRDYIVNECEIFVKRFFFSPIDMSVWCFFYSLLIQWIMQIDFPMLSYCSISGISVTWLWYIILFIHWYIQFDNNSLRSFAFKIRGSIRMKFFFFFLFAVFSIRVTLTSDWNVFIPLPIREERPMLFFLC